ncbi:MAG TPA: phosphoenolpyruvate carboxykinase (ATP), partial [Geminicoccaceae bacterium]|nr:phosphoenolpyruvate carboxykinase (ATP) [Geminicoccaceae bacterium]
MEQIGPVISRHGLEGLGLAAVRCVRWNLTAPALVQLAVAGDEGSLVAGGAFSAVTGRHTGRAPRDRFIVEQAEIRDAVDWGQVNQPIPLGAAERLWAKARVYARGRELFVQDLYAGADPAHRLRVRVITETAWHSLFARNMFRVPPRDALGDFEPDFTVLQLPGLSADRRTDGTRSETAILLDLAARQVLICGTLYAGEIKKSIFTALNFLLPDADVLPMHCSANVGARGDVAVFFGLSGTGKTTLSADPTRTLIGDDEHGW